MNCGRLIDVSCLSVHFFKQSHISCKTFLGWTKMEDGGVTGVHSLQCYPPLDLRSRWHAPDQCIHCLTYLPLCIQRQWDQVFTANIVASLSESNSSNSFCRRQRPPPTPTGNRPRPTKQPYFSRLLQCWTWGWQPKSVKKITTEEFSMKSASQPLLLPARRMLGDSHHHTPQLHLHLGIIQTLDSTASRQAWERAYWWPIVETATLQYGACHE